MASSQGHPGTGAGKSISEVRRAMVAAAHDLQDELLSDAARSLAAQSAGQPKRKVGGRKRPRPAPTRRSSRLSQLPAVQYTEEEGVSVRGRGTGAARGGAAGSTEAAEDLTPVVLTPPRQRISAQATAALAGKEDFKLLGLPAAGKLVLQPLPGRDEKGQVVSGSASARTLQCDVTGTVARWLGKYIPYAIAGSGAKAKAAAMYVLGAVAEEEQGGPGVPICRNVVFNKMSGIQPWANAVALFVNVDLTPDAGGYDGRVSQKDGSAYGNQFGPGGSTATWFAQPRHTPETLLLQRMVSVQRIKEWGVEVHPDRGQGPPVPVVLFLRLPGRPYVFAGRCECAAVQHNARPMRFTWALQDAARAAAAAEEGWRHLQEHAFPPTT